MQKISEFLKEVVHSHAIYKAEEIAKDFTWATGVEPCWPVHSYQMTLLMIQDRGLGGSLVGNDGENFVWGYEIAESLAKKYTNYDPGHIQGRGTRTSLAIESLEKVNL